MGNAWPQINRISSGGSGLSSRGSGLSKVDVPAFPVHDFQQRKDTFKGRSISSVSPTYPQARGLGANQQRWAGKKEAGHTAFVTVPKP